MIDQHGGGGADKGILQDREVVVYDVPGGRYVAMATGLWATGLWSWWMIRAKSHAKDVGRF